jgi:tRNA(Arg) A34 adenosine deaminase TadA
MNEENFLKEAVSMAAQNVKNGGGPFGAVIVKDGKIIGRGINRVTETNDPTAHAEVTAIRDACKNLDDFRLDGAVIYTSCEPCPMCLGAIYWARIDKIVFAADKNDAAKAGFDDSFIYDEFALTHEKRAIPLKRLPLKNANLPFETWIKHEGKTNY